jgi:hypothetical protein
MKSINCFSSTVVNEAETREIEMKTARDEKRVEDFGLFIKLLLCCRCRLAKRKKISGY